jgi:hypothetical protein
MNKGHFMALSLNNNINHIVESHKNTSLKFRLLDVAKTIKTSILHYVICPSAVHLKDKSWTVHSNMGYAGKHILQVGVYQH